MKRFLVIGLGRFGRAVAEGLVDEGGEVIAVDTDMALVEAVRDRVTVAAQIDNVESATLGAIGAAQADAAVVAIGEDFAAGILTVASLKDLGIKTIVARASTDRERQILELVGATRIVTVEVESGQRLARALAATDAIDTIALGAGVSIVYWTADARVVGRALADSELRTRWELNLVALRPAGSERLEVLPAPDRVFREGDVLLLAGTDARLAAFTR